MQINRRNLLLMGSALAVAGVPATAKAQNTQMLRLGITLEPPGLDPTVSASSSISEICLYNLYETLTKIMPNGQVQPLLAHAWEVSSDVRAYTFYLLKGVYFHNGQEFNAQTVAYSLARAGAQGSTNKDRYFYENIERFVIIDSHTIRLELKKSDPDLLFKLGMGTAIMVEPSSAENNRTRPVGTGPYVLQNWRKGAALILQKWLPYRNSPHIAIERAVFQFISDSYAQMASLLAGDVDVFARVAIARSLSAFKRQPERFQIVVSNSRAKTLMSINHRRTPLNDLRVRQAISCAIDRNVIVEGAADGFGFPIGSHYTPGMPAYADMTDLLAYDPQRSRELLQAAGINTPLQLDFILPPAPYARQGGELIASMLRQVGIHTRMESVEWAQWLSKVYTQHDFDLSIVSHVEPLDLDSYTQPNYYWGYDSSEFRSLYAQIESTPEGEHRNALLVQAQEMLARDAVNVWLYQPRWITVANARLKGLWEDMPIFVNDLSSMRWQ